MTIEFICDKCGARVKDMPEEAIKQAMADPFKKHICESCITDEIRERANRIVDAPLGYASADMLASICYKLECALNIIEHITPPPISYSQICSKCGETMILISPMTGEYYCNRCKATYDDQGHYKRSLDEVMQLYSKDTLKKIGEMK